jgi:hypothetical protein
MDIQIISSGKVGKDYQITLILSTKRNKYKETFYGNQDILEHYVHLIENTQNIKAKLKFYNKLRQHCPNFKIKRIDDQSTL